MFPYHLMLNTSVGNEIVVTTILNTMQYACKKPTVSLTSFKPEEEHATK